LFFFCSEWKKSPVPQRKTNEDARKFGQEHNIWRFLPGKKVEHLVFPADDPN